MKIKDKFKVKRPLLSFEIFPPKANYPVDTIYNSIDELYNLYPDFMSVTYGAGGSTKDKTIEISSYIQNKYNLTSIAHITCISSSRNEINNILNSLKENNVHNVLALRGDYPKDTAYTPPNDGFKNSVELIEYFRKNTNLCIGAACYPEKHPDAYDLNADIDFLKRKADAGADFLITQMFFDNELFYDFFDKVQKKGINLPIITGIMPILNKNQIKAIVNLTGNLIPAKLRRILDKYENNPVALNEAGISYAISQIIDLLSWGVDGIHIYTMNKPSTAKKILGSISAIRGVLTNESKSS
ncbi:methylenetetrahydrofolate reductase [NAD(P)H] [Sedimentibacter sp.]|uniref:methylenetetrahydrofolate reductase [NAD(P)H] n=2 Tax=Sedimentibacter sp. TaxID=1960295 RepID=UPI0028AA4C35|nr:methylenetetrahydrofolate reductase [NAD(P)H] [Sedimentibacter sp.]